MEVPKNFRTQKELLKDLKKDVVKEMISAKGKAVRLIISDENWLETDAVDQRHVRLGGRRHDAVFQAAHGLHAQRHHHAGDDLDVEHPVREEALGK